MVRWISRVLALSLLAVPAIDGSSGEEDPSFRTRLARCSSRCPAHTGVGADAAVSERSSSVAQLVKAVRQGAGWSCAEECQYSAMHEHTAERVAAGKDVLQYYGK